MTTWGKVLAEIQGKSPDPAACDLVRREKTAALTKLTGRPLVIYATACTSPGKPVPDSLLMIDPADKLGFIEVTAKISPPNLDVLIHSPGGVADAVDAIVGLLRARFTNIRFLVPFYAKSAATMLALSGDEVLMTAAAELGPIDPQMPVVLPNGVVMFSAAHSIKEQYVQAQNEVNSDPRRLPGWIATLSHPSRLAECDMAIQRAKALVENWLTAYMFSGDPDGAKKASEIADYLGEQKNFQSHGCPIRVNDAKLKDSKVRRAADLDPALEEAIWELYCAIDHTFGNTAAVKFYENSLIPVDGVYRLVQQIAIPVGVPNPPSVPSPGTPSLKPAAPPLAPPPPPAAPPGP